MSFLEKNLAAMEKWTQGTAGAIRAAGVPAGFGKAMGTDGVETFLRVHQEPRGLEWLGGTSMPSGSAGAMVAGLQVGMGNGLGLSMGTGYEWKAYAGKLPGGQAVFVWEPDAGVARMALEICDLSEELRGGKVVLVTGDGGVLAGFLREQVGYEVPTVLHPLASLMGDRRNELVKTGEVLVRRVMGERQLLVQKLREEVRSQKPVAGSVVAMTGAERYVGEKPLQGELRRMRASGAEVEEIRLDHFASGSLALRLKVLAEKRPGKVVGDYFRGQIGCLPESVALETWVPPMVGGGYWQRERFAGMGAGDRVVVHAGVHREMLMEMGVEAGCIEVRAPGGEARSQKPEVGSQKPEARSQKQEVRSQEPGARMKKEPPKGGTPNRVAVVGDLVDCSMEALGIVLPTHQAVYVAAREIVEGEYLTVHIGSAGDVLRRALVRAGVSVGTDGAADSSLKEPMLRMIRDVLIRVAPLMTLAKKLQEEGLEVELVGQWPGMREGANWSPNWEQVGVLVHLSPWGVVSPLVLEAAAAGVAVIGPRHATDEREGSLAKVLGARYERVEAGRLVGRVKGMVRGRN